MKFPALHFSPVMRIARQGAWFALATLLLLAAAAWSYADALHGPFLMDDYGAIFPLLAREAAGAGWWQVITEAPAHIRMRWLANLSFLVSHEVSGGRLPPSAFAFKAGNLAVHLACAAVIAALTASLSRQWGVTARRATWIGILTAGVFLLHPLLLSTVLYPVQRMAQLSALFVLLAVLAYVQWRKQLDRLTPMRHFTHVGAILAFTGLAFSSKENGALAPLLILVTEVTSFRWPIRGSAAHRRFETGFGLVCAGPLVLGLVLLATRWEVVTSGYEHRDFTMYERLLTQVHVLSEYLGQIAWPRIHAMGLFRDDFPMTRSLEAGTVALVLSGVAAVAAGFIWRRRIPALAFAPLWFFAAHAMESSILALEPVFEHRNYLAILGPAMLLAWGISALPRPLAAASAAILLLGLGLLTHERARAWRDFDTWITAEASNHPGSLRAGSELFLHQWNIGAIARAAESRDRLEARHPDHAQPVLLKLAFACAGPLVVPTFSQDELRRLELGNVGKDAYHLYLGLRDDLGDGRCATPMWHDFSAAAIRVAQNPHLGGDRIARAAWWKLAGDAAIRAGDWTAAARAAESAVKIFPTDAQAWLQLMEVRVGQGDPRAYAQARLRFQSITRGRFGAATPHVRRLDAAAANLAADRP
jgi:hypothetical protein